MNRRAEVAMSNRGDLSMFLVHLTRDDRNHRTEEDGGRSAHDNFVNMMKRKTICALSIHCLHHKQLRKLPTKTQKQFRTVCFTETPLDQLSRLLDVGPRDIDLEPFGFVFKRDFLYKKGAQPVTYINDYGDSPSRDAADSIFELSERSGFTGRACKLLPFLNVMYDGHDFAWEREWRVVGDLEFEHEDLECVILPEDEFKLRERVTRIGVPAIDPKWGYERIVSEFAAQQREMKKLLKAEAQSKT